MTNATCSVPRTLALAVLLAGAMGSVQAAPPPAAPGQGAEHARIVEHWTPARRAAAIPRDLVIDERGYGYLKLPNGALQPYGHTVLPPRVRSGRWPSRARAIPPARPSPISIPAAGVTVTTTAYSFKATVTDAGGVRSVSFRVGPKGGLQSAFTATAGAGGVYTANLTGLADGAWTWSVVAKDNANNTTTTPLTEFTVSLGSGGGGGGGGGSNGTVVTNAAYTGGGKIQNAVGRIYFEMPSNSRRTRWAGYVCSGTVVADGTSGRSVIQTAAHCVYDDAYKAYARNVMFIPNQDGTTGAGTDLNCGNDPLGCWTTWFGVVDSNWTTRTFPDNIPWDYAYYVVKDSGAYTPGRTTVNDGSGRGRAAHHRELHDAADVRRRQQRHGLRHGARLFLQRRPELHVLRRGPVAAGRRQLVRWPAADCRAAPRAARGCSRSPTVTAAWSRSIPGATPTSRACTARSCRGRPHPACLRGRRPPTSRPPSTATRVRRPPAPEQAAGRLS